MFKINKNNLILFDCDGVVLNSNQIKSEAFFNVAAEYNTSSAFDLVEYNKKNGGLSRYKKFQYYLEKILPKYANLKLDSNKLAIKFGEQVKKALLKCEISPYLFELKNKYPDTNWAIISGGDQSELRYIFNERKLSYLFNMGIWGSPSSKFEIVENNFRSCLKSKILYLGDSKLDHEVAKYYNFDFIFVSDWTEFTGWKSYIKEHSIKTIKNLDNL